MGAITIHESQVLEFYLKSGDLPSKYVQPSRDLGFPTIRLSPNYDWDIYYHRGSLGNYIKLYPKIGQLEGDSIHLATRQGTYLNRWDSRELCVLLKDGINGGKLKLGKETHIAAWRELL